MNSFQLAADMILYNELTRGKAGAAVEAENRV